jgi:hypothetical protein
MSAGSCRQHAAADASLATRELPSPRHAWTRMSLVLKSTAGEFTSPGLGAARPRTPRHIRKRANIENMGPNWRGINGEIGPKLEDICYLQVCAAAASDVLARHTHCVSPQHHPSAPEPLQCIESAPTLRNAVHSCSGPDAYLHGVCPFQEKRNA